MPNALRKQSVYFAFAGVFALCFVFNSASGQVIFDIHPIGSVQLCAGGSVTIHADSLPPGYTYAWYREYYTAANCSFEPGYEQLSIYDGQQDISADGTNIYWCEARDQNGLVAGQSTGSVWITSLSEPEPICYNGSLTFCKPSTVEFYSIGVWAGSAGIMGIQMQWQLNGVDISGATWASYIAPVSGTYRCKFSNTCGSVYSNSFVVNALPLPSAVITASGPTTFCAGGSVTLNAVIAANRAYQWKKNGTDISGATASGYVATASGTYKVTVTNTVTGCTKTTPTGIVVTKNPLPVATISPSGTITFCAGQSALLTANSGGGYTYKWKKNGAYISGATSITYTVTTAGKYRVEVTNSNGCSKTSNADTVNVPCKEGENIAESAAGFDMTIYPNPSPGVFTIQLSDNPSAPVTIEITDVIGKIVDRFVVNDETVVLDKSNLVPGIYYLSVRNKEMMLVKKLVIQ